MSLSLRLQKRLDSYGRSHSGATNKLLHYLGIPFLTIAVLGMVARLGLTLEADWVLAPPNAAWLVIAVAAGWYAWLDWRIAILTTVGSLACFAVGAYLSLWVLAALAGLGIVAHMIGHFGFEGKPPSTLKDPLSVLDAPIWLVATWTGMYKPGSEVRLPERESAIKAA